jgi:pimeloyl-ACP methyl ester carboxylesterase
MEKTDVSLGELTFRILTAGPPNGRPVVFLHGFPQSAGEWKAQLATLGEAGFRCVAPDQRRVTLNDFGR